MKFKIKLFRFISQMFFLILVTVASFRHQLIGGGPNGAPNIHTLCPFGGIESLYTFFTKGEFIKKIQPSNLVLLAGTVFLVLVMGRYFCAWICALGTMQEIFGKIGKKIFKKRYFIPKNIDDVLRYLKYLVLFSVIYITWNTGKLIINAYDPFAAYAHIPAGIGELLDDYLVGFAILILSLILSMFFDRFFCKYTCPLGAFFGILKKLSFYKIKRNEYSCINCSRCSDVCPVNIEVDKVKEIKSSECINCLDCVAACPTKPNSISAHIYKKPLNPHWVFIGGLLIYLGFIGGGRVLGYWKTTPSNVQNIIKSNPENIRGWMTLNLVSEEFGIPLKLLYDKLGLKSGDFPPDIMIKDAEKGLEEKGIEFKHDALPLIVAEIISEKNKTEFIIKGYMSISDISVQTGLNEEDIILRLGMPANFPTDIPLKELKDKFEFDVTSLNEKFKS